MDPITQFMMQGAGGAAGGETYVDDVFNTDVWTGDGAAHQVVNNIRLSSKGGMVWMKSRSNSDNHMVADTVRGSNKVIFPDANSVEQTSDGYFTSLNDNGFTTGSSNYVNDSSKTFAAWTFRKAPGFFDIVTYTGTGSSRTIAHNLGSVPGMIIVKQLSAVANWTIYHRDIGNTKAMYFTSAATYTDSAWWNNTDPTASVFTLGNSDNINKSGESYVAYVYAGGESTAANANSVSFDGSGDYLSIPSSPDFNFGTGDFTVEAWCYRNGGFFTIFDHLMGADEFIIFSYSNNDIRVYSSSGGGHLQSNVNPGNKKWFHLAVQRKSGVLEFFIDGQKASSTPTFTLNIPQSGAQIGRSGSGGYCDGLISNLRVVKGTAIYTSSFKPSTVPLTSISGTVLLCCNNSSVTGSTVTPGTITASGNVAASTGSPFDDPDGFVFGKNEDQNIIKTGSYVGTGSVGHKIELGWEPSFIIFKNSTDSGDNWEMVDVMRGNPASDGTTSQDANFLRANTNGAEFTNRPFSPYSTGFEIRNAGGGSNGSGSTYIYIAIRRSDGYVGKPAEAGTDAFAIDLGNSSATQMFTSGFPVDFATEKFYTTGSYNWGAASRLTAKNYLYINTTAAEAAYSSFTFDQMDGWGANSGWDSTAISYMWKRHAGFDVVTYTGDGASGRQIPHNLGKTPEMIWVKRRNANENWYVYHKGVNGGTNPGDYMLYLNATNAKIDHDQAWSNSLPTSTHFILGNDTAVNSGGTTRYITMLFASVDGISKVGSYDGTGSTQTITTGFSPRFIIIKRSNSSENWLVFDTVRGWAAGNDKSLKLNSTDPQSSGTWDVGAPTATGFTLVSNYNTTNASGGKYIYYAHA